MPTDWQRKPPAPYPGGKTKAAPLIWSLLGDPAHYVEAFCGMASVLLNRPHECNRTYFSETINDADGWVVNAYRAIQLHPEATAEAASWPVSEADKIARQVACCRWRDNAELEHLMGDPAWCDPLIAGYWLYGVACQIGFFTGDGPWTVDRRTGRIYKQPRGKFRAWGAADGGEREPGVSRNLPQLTAQGRAVNAPQLREPGVSRNRPHLGKIPGQGINDTRLREPGVSRNRPTLIPQGVGVNSPQLREPGVSRDLPHLRHDGQAVNAPQLREPGVAPPDDAELVPLEGTDFHPLVMPKLLAWFRLLQARLRHVRIVNGDWHRVCTHGALYTLSVGKKGPAGVFLDPPYAATERTSGLYASDADGRDLAAECREWCREHGDDPDLRIVLAGYDTEHPDLEAAGWSVYEWFKGGFLTGGMANTGGSGKHQQHRERLWASPQCLDLDPNAKRPTVADVPPGSTLFYREEKR